MSSVGPTCTARPTRSGASSPRPPRGHFGMLAPWRLRPLTTIISFRDPIARQPKEVRRCGSHSSGRNPAPRRESYISHKCLVRSLPEQRRHQWSAEREADGRSRRCGRVLLLAALAFSSSAASSQDRSPRETKAFHATKDCSGFTGLVGAYCTIRSSNVKALKVGSKIFYFQVAGKTALDSDTVIYVSAAASQPAIASFVSRPGSDCARSRTARERSPGSVSVCVSRPMRRSRSCGTGTGRTASVRARSVGKRPVNERVARWLSSLSSKYIAVFALLVAVP